AWTLIGGITTVIWTDVLLFMMFLLGAAAALIAIAWSVPDGFMGIIGAGLAAGDGSGPSGKFTFFDTTTEWPGIFTQPYTIWAAVIAATWGSLHPYGVDQLIVQRMFCCRNPAEARKALISSFAGQLVTFTVAFVGIGLYAYYQRYPLSGTALALYEEKPDRIFPLFVVYSGAIPAGLKGLIIAGIFAAAVSSLTSILAALSQTTLSAFSVMDERDDSATGGDRDMSRRAVLAGRLLVLMWGVVL